MIALLWTLCAAHAIDAHRIGTPIVVDGHLDEAAWALATPITDFVKFAPTEGGAPPGPTDVRILHDDDHLYIGVRMDHGRPVRYRWAPREDINQDDQIGIFLDTFVEEHAGYVFYFNPLGVQQDLRVNSGRWNFYWDAVLDAKGTVDGTGWDLEVAIPFRSLKYPAGSGPQEWGLFVQRIDVHDLSVYSYPIAERDPTALFANAAPLRLEPPPSGSGLELVPSLTAVQQGAKVTDGEPMAWTGVSQPLEAFRPALDLRFGITPNIGFTGTINPDFSQVENDETPIELNQRFAFWFDERRPFFLDGADLFEDRAGLLYSRSIVEPVGGIKVGGKEGPISVGLLHAIDRSPGASIHERGTPGFSEEDLDGAWTANTVTRVVTEAGSGAVGVSFADKRVLRTKSGEDDTQGFNDALVLDAFVPLAKRWVVAGSLMGSLSGDGRGSMLAGTGFEGQVGRQSGMGTGGYLSGRWLHPGLRFETGFEPQSGYGEVGAGVDHTFEPAFLDTLRPGVDGHVHLEDDGDGWYTTQVNVEGHVGANGFGGWFGRRSEWLAGVKVDGFHGGGWYWARPTGWLEINPSMGTQRVLDYQRLAGAQATGADLRLTLWPTRHIRLDTSLGLRWLAPEDDALVRSTRVRGKLGYQFTRTLGTRLIAEYAAGTAREDRLTGSLLFTWLLHPGTGVWVGYAEAATLGASYEATERVAFVKVSFLLRPPTRRLPTDDALDGGVLGDAEASATLLPEDWAGRAG